MIGDVGQNHVEEVDFRTQGAARGVNFGWRAWEGARRNFDEPRAGRGRFRVTKTAQRGWCSITGGYVVRDRALGSLSAATCSG